MTADMQRSMRRSNCAQIAQRMIYAGLTFLSHSLSPLHHEIDRVDERLLRLSQCDRLAQNAWIGMKLHSMQTLAGTCPHRQHGMQLCRVRCTPVNILWNCKASRRHCQLCWLSTCKWLVL